ncbi:hypothetical protein ABTW80_02465 [Micromonospora chalcea]
MQWSREIGLLIRDLRLSEGELRYLTLPGPDLLDVRHLALTICTREEVKLKYLGFNTAALPLADSQTELNSAQFSVNRLANVHPDSEVFPGDFRMVGNSRSIPWQRVRRAGPFHAINIDLCGGFAGVEKPAGIPNYFAAMQALLQNQSHSSEDFVLFITTRMDDDNVDSETLEKLNSIAQAIHDTCEEYASEFADAWGLSTKGRPIHIRQVASTAEAFMLGLTQWIVSRGIRSGLKASVRSFMTYRTGIEPGEDDIVSLAIRFKPDPILHDPHGLVQVVPAQVPAEERERQQSTAIPRKVRGRVMVDKVLRSQADAFERCVEESAMLLASAGFDGDSYRTWVMTEGERYATA